MWAFKRKYVLDLDNTWNSRGVPVGPTFHNTGMGKNSIWANYAAAPALQSRLCGQTPFRTWTWRGAKEYHNTDKITHLDAT